DGPALRATVNGCQEGDLTAPDAGASPIAHAPVWERSGGDASRQGTWSKPVEPPPTASPQGIETQETWSSSGSSSGPSSGPSSGRVSGPGPGSRAEFRPEFRPGPPPPHPPPGALRDAPAEPPPDTRKVTPKEGPADWPKERLADHNPSRELSHEAS